MDSDESPVDKEAATRDAKSGLDVLLVESTADNSGAGAGDELESLLNYLKVGKGFDFTRCKRSTLSRRFEKRMQALGITTYPAYQDYLEAEPPEVNELFSSILINETLEELQGQLEELQVAQEELRIQNEALETAATDLAAEQMRYKRLFDYAPVAYLITNAKGKIIEANLAACDLLNIPQQFIQSKLLTSLVPVAYRKPFRKHLLSLKDIESEVEAEVYFQTRKVGRVTPFTASAWPVRSVGQAVAEIRWILKPSVAKVEAAAPEFTTPKNDRTNPVAGGQIVAPAEMDSSVPSEQDLQILQLYARAHSQLWQFHEAQELMDFLSQKAAELVGNYCFLSVLTADGKQLIPVAAGSRGKMSDAVVKQFKQAKAQPVSSNIAEQVLKSQEPCVIAGVADPGLDMEKVLFKQGAVNMLLVPIRTGESSIGLLTLMRDQTDKAYNKQDLTLLQNLADYAGVILLNHKLRRHAIEDGGAATEQGAFMFAVCTDMQGPMHAIAGFAGMLQEQAQELSLPELEKDAQRIEMAAEHVNHLLTQLFDLSRVESGTSGFRIERISASTLVADVETEVRNLLGISDFAIEREDNLNLVQLKIDAFWARQAVCKAVSVMQNSCTRCIGQVLCEDQHLWFVLHCEGKKPDLNIPVVPGCDVESLFLSDDLYCIRDSSDTSTRLGVMLVQRVCRVLNAEFKFEFINETDAVIKVGFSLVK